MSITVNCDYCGEEISRGDTQVVTIEACGDKGGAKRDRWKDGYVGHYHGEPCYPAVLDAICEIHRSELDLIPTATPEQLAALRPGDHVEGSLLDYEPLFWMEKVTYRNGGKNEYPRLREDLVERGLVLKGVNERKVYDWGIVTVGDLRRAIEDKSLLMVQGVGRTRLELIRAELHCLDATLEQPCTDAAAAPRELRADA